MKRLWIVGAGGFGREVRQWALDVPERDRGWQFHGFLDDNAAALEGFPRLSDPLEPISGFQPGENDLVLVAVGDPVLKKKLAETLRAKGARFARLLHPSAIVGEGVSLGEGVILCPHAILSCDIEVGRFVAFNCYSGAGHDARLGDYVVLSGHCDITGGVRLGEGVFLGSNATVLPRLTVGAYARIGAGSVVIQDVAAGVSVFGNPARPI